MTDQERTPKSAPAAAVAAADRKPYGKPSLRVYGDVAALTRSVGNTTTNADGGHGSMSKTH